MQVSLKASLRRYTKIEKMPSDPRGLIQSFSYDSKKTSLYEVEVMFYFDVQTWLQLEAIQTTTRALHPLNMISE